MRLFVISLLMLSLVAAFGCASAQKQQESFSLGGGASAPNSSAQTARASAEGAAQPAMQTISLKQADASQSATVADAVVARKIIRNATLSLEVEEPAKAIPRVASIAEARGGFVVTSDSRQQSGSDGNRSYEVITIELRVPEAQFDAALNEIRGVGSRVTAQKITGQDVTEEYIDLEARLRTQKALEAQLLEIMKGAHAVADALAVQRELANVRTEVERLEGRRRFLENQSSLSTISVTLQPPSPLISTTGFTHSVGSAFGDGIDIAAVVTLGLIRIVLALLPVALFIFLPIALVVRYLLRRARRRKAALQAIQSPPAE